MNDIYDIRIILNIFFGKLIYILNWEKNYLTIHALIDKKLKTKDIINLKKDMKELLKKEWIDHSVIEFEREDENCEKWDFCNE